MLSMEDEIITVGLLREILKLRTDKDCWRLIAEKFQDMFPKLCEYYLKRLKNLGLLMYRVHQRLSDINDNVQLIIDTVDLLQ